MPRTLATTALTTAGLIASLASCGSPTRPSVSVASRPASLASGAQVSYYSQPVTLVVAGGVATSGATPTTIVEVAADAAFTNIVTTQTASRNASGQLTITVDHLSPATTYYLRAKTTAGDNPGIFSDPATLTVGPLLQIQPPTPLQPLADSFPHKRPTFAVKNAMTNTVQAGVTADLAYRFDVALDVAFTNIAASGTVSEGAVQTAFVPSNDLPSGTKYYWRARAGDSAKGVTSDYSPSEVFTTVNPDDGAFRYILTLHLVSAANCIFDNIGGSHPVPPLVLPDISFDDALTVTGDNLRFAPFPPDPNRNIKDLELDIARTGNQLSATFAGWNVPWVQTIEIRSVSGLAVVPGTDDNSGRLTGAGPVTLLQHSGGLSDTYCSDAQMAFALKPYR
jgi:hypothetical protein